MKIHFLFIFFSLFLWAETLNEQIHALEGATPTERVELMNHIKEQLISMNEAERMKTLGVLKAKLHPKEEDSSAIKHEQIGKNQEDAHESENQDSMQSCMGEHNIEHASPMMHQEERMNQEWQQHRRERQNEERQQHREERDDPSYPHERDRNIPTQQNDNQNHGDR